MKLIYIAGSYSGDITKNVRKAIDTAEEIIKIGFAVYVPHLSHLWDLMSPHDYSFWIKNDNEILKVCDALFVIDVQSNGIKREIELAEKYKIPLFISLNKLKEWGKKEREEKLENG